jgi:hypothetical protein
LELASATLIADIMRTTRLDPVRGALQYALESGPREPPVFPNLG